MTETDSGEPQRIVKQSSNFLPNFVVGGTVLALAWAGKVAIFDDTDKRPELEDRQAEVAPPSPEELQAEIEARRAAFMDRIHNHPANGVCKMRVGEAGLPALVERELGDANLWHDVLANSPWSHSSSIAKSQNGQPVDSTTNLSTVNIALDERFAPLVAGSRYICDYDQERQAFIYELTTQEIYPTGTPSVEVMKTIIESTIAIRQVGDTPEQKDGWHLRINGVHIGNGNYLAPWLNGYLERTDPETGETELIDVNETTFTSPTTGDQTLTDTEILASHLSTDEHYSVIKTDVDGPEVKFGSTEDMMPGDTVILSGYDDRQANTTEPVLFLYRGVVLEVRDNGQLVIATGIEDAGSYDRSSYYPRFGAQGSAIFNTKGELIGTLGSSGVYDYSWSVEKSDKGDDIEEPWANQVINILSKRLGFKTPAQLSKEADKAGNYNRPDAAIDSIAEVWPLPPDIEQLAAK